MNFIKERLLKLSRVLLRNKVVFLAMKILRVTTEWVDPVSTNYRGYDVWELPPNGQGMAALQMLNIIEGMILVTFHLVVHTLSTKLKNWF
jgi:gamma-glutamyltranspeptidase/glutathione hydrolase